MGSLYKYIKSDLLYGFISINGSRSHYEETATWQDQRDDPADQLNSRLPSAVDVSSRDMILEVRWSIMLLPAH